MKILISKQNHFFFVQSRILESIPSQEFQENLENWHPWYNYDLELFIKCDYLWNLTYVENYYNIPMKNIFGTSDSSCLINKTVHLYSLSAIQNINVQLNKESCWLVF